MTLRSAIITGTASININGTVGATTPSTGAFTTLTSALATTIGTVGAGGTVSQLLSLIGRNSDGYAQFNFFANNGTTNNAFIGATSAGLDIGIGGTVRQSLSSAGIVTFGAYGAGAATFSAAGVISSVSDETWKVKDGAPVDPDAMLNKLKPGYWYYNEDKKDTFGTDRQLGFYAQNVNAAIGPEAAPEPETFTTKNEDGTETIATKPWGYYDRSVLAVTVMSLQKALATIESLTARITALENK